MVQQLISHPDEFELVGCYEPEAALISRRSIEWGPLVSDLKFYSRLDELFSQRLDGVVVEGRVAENLGYAGAALERGLPVLLEKPAGFDFSAFQALQAEAKRQQLFVQMSYLFRWMPAVVALREAVRTGSLGEIYEFRGRLPKPRGEYAEYLVDLSDLPGGIFFEMAGHLFDFCLATCGPPRQVRSFLAHHQPPGEGVGSIAEYDAANCGYRTSNATSADAFIDSGVTLLEFDRSLGIIEANALEVVPGQRRIEVYGSRGAFIIPHLGSGHQGNTATQPYDLFTADTQRWTRCEPELGPLQISDLREFVAVARGTKPPEFSAEHDLAVHAALLQACGLPVD